MGNWEEAEMLDKVVKEAAISIGDYMYAMECMIGSKPIDTQDTNVFECIFDTSTSITSAFAEGFDTYSNI